MAVARGEPRIALVVGNGRYGEGNGILENAPNDARAVAEALSRIGFSGVRADGDDFSVDLSTPGVSPLLNLDNTKMMKALKAMARFSPGVKQAVIFYAGHGIEAEGENYLIPVGAKLEHITDAKFEAQALTTVLGSIEKATELRLVILDACRNNPFRTRLFRGRGASGGLSRVEPPENMLVAYSARHGLLASDGEKGSINSPFSKALLTHIESPGLEIVQLFRKVQSSVKTATNGAQLPHLYGSLGEEQVYLVPPGGAGNQSTSSVTSPDKPGFVVESPQSQRRPPPSSNLPNFSVALGVVAAAAAVLTIEWFGKSRTTPTATETPVTGIEKKAATPASLACSGVEVDVLGKGRRCLEPENAVNREFEDCFTTSKGTQVCIPLVLLPKGSYPRGSESGEPNEKPVRSVTIGYHIAVGKFEVTFNDWDACVEDGGCTYRPETKWGRGRLPVHSICWNDVVVQYLHWLNAKLGNVKNARYRLLKEAEWEYAARAGTTGNYWFGDEITSVQARFAYRGGSYSYKGSEDDYRPVDVGSYPPNGFGLYDMHGNLWEWVQDCYAASYVSVPTNGAAASEVKDCLRVRRGGSWSNTAKGIRSSMRHGEMPDNRGRSTYTGFRLARTVEASAYQDGSVTSIRVKTPNDSELASIVGRAISEKLKGVVLAPESADESELYVLEAGAGYIPNITAPECDPQGVATLSFELKAPDGQTVAKDNQVRGYACHKGNGDAAQVRRMARENAAVGLADLLAKRWPCSTTSCLPTP